MEDEPGVPRPSQPAPAYFPVSATKLVVLSLCSLGLYELYWFYQHWKLEYARTEEPMSPFWRAVFAPLFAYSLFRRIQEFGAQRSLDIRYSPGALAATFFALGACWRLPDPFWLVSLLSFLPLMPVRTAVAAINLAHAPEASTNGRFSGGNVVLVIVGGLFLLLALVGTFVPQEPS